MTKSLSEMLQIEIHFDEIEIENSSEFRRCELNPKECNDYFNKLENECRKLQLQLNRSVHRIQKLQEVINDVRVICGNNQYSNYFYSLFLDNRDYLTCVIFNIEEFEPTGNGNPDLNLSFGKRFGHPSRMYTTYERYSGALVIDDFFSECERVGHGAIMLKALLKLVPELNKKIDAHNKMIYNELKGRYYSTWEEFLNSINHCKQITHIKGKLVPNRGLTMEDLIRFYSRNGFMKDGRLYKEV